MQDATLCFLVKGNPVNEILLGFKKIGFGEGKYNGIGGKIEEGETVQAAAVRELEEETRVRAQARDIERVAHLTFFFPARPEWNQVVHVFLVQSWEGEPTESDEMRPTWFDVNEIPFAEMWADDAHWLPLVLSGRKVKGTFTFGKDNESITELEMEEWGGMAS